MVYLPTFTIKISQMWVNIPYMDPMGYRLGRWLGVEPFVFLAGTKSATVERCDFSVLKSHQPNHSLNISHLT